MTEISTAVSVVAAISVAVERVTEILKQMIPWLAQPQADPGTWSWRTTVLQLLAVGIGIAIAAVGNLQIGGRSGPEVYILIGLLSAGGSRFWNNVLEIIKAMKVSREADAELKLRLRSELDARVKALEGAQERHDALSARVTP